MKPGVYTYQDPIKQTTYFRGYCKEYTDSPTVIVHTCTEVRTNKAQALRDATTLRKKCLA